MKVIYTLVIVVAITCNISAQLNKLVLFDSKWTEVVKFNLPDSSGNIVYSSQSVFYLGNNIDTSVSGFPSVALYYMDYSVDTIPVSGDFNMIGYLYENQNNQVYFMKPNCCSGHVTLLLMYDFSKLPGDTILYTTDTTDQIYANKYLVISYIDSVLIENSYRKQFHFSNSNDIWIDGIGSIYGLTRPITYTYDCDCNSQLVCYQNQNQTKYLNPAYTTCYPGFSSSQINEITSKNSIRIFPNPVTSVSQIIWGSQSDMNAKIEIFNISGERILNENIATNSFTISRNKFSSGFYIFKVILTNQTYTGKFIIQ